MLAKGAFSIRRKPSELAVSTTRRLWFANPGSKAVRVKTHCDTAQISVFRVYARSLTDPSVAHTGIKIENSCPRNLETKSGIASVSFPKAPRLFYLMM